jgi:hypothetical protein
MIWKDVIGFEGLYLVSNTGLIRSIERKSVNTGSYSGYVLVKERLLKQTINRLGYHVVTLHKGGVRYFKIVHRLVAESFLDNYSSYKEVNHKDLNKSNNSVVNLEWCDRKHNVNHMYSNKHKSSNYKGVSYVKDRNKWYAYVDLNGKRLYLGKFESEKVANEYRLNFINQLNNIKHETLI